MKTIFLVSLVLLCSSNSIIGRRNKPEDKTKCPQVKAIRNFDLKEVMYCICLMINQIITANMQ